MLGLSDYVFEIDDIDIDLLWAHVQELCTNLVLLSNQLDLQMARVVEESLTATKSMLILGRF